MIALLQVSVRALSLRYLARLLFASGSKKGESDVSTCSLSSIFISWRVMIVTVSVVNEQKFAGRWKGFGEVSDLRFTFWPCRRWPYADVPIELIVLNPTYRATACDRWIGPWESHCFCKFTIYFIVNSCSEIVILCYGPVLVKTWRYGDWCVQIRCISNTENYVELHQKYFSKRIH
jgi:hypothetical protein